MNEIEEKFDRAFTLLHRSRQLIREIHDNCELSICEMNDITLEQLYSCDPEIIKSLYGLTPKGKIWYMDKENFT